MLDSTSPARCQSKNASGIQCTLPDQHGYKGLGFVHLCQLRGATVAAWLGEPLSFSEHTVLTLTKRHPAAEEPCSSVARNGDRCDRPYGHLGAHGLGDVYLWVDRASRPWDPDAQEECSDDDGGCHCPHCGEYNTDLWELSDGAAEYECDSCGGPLRLDVIVTTTYTLTKRHSAAEGNS